jgi:hypothetical protein
MIKKHLLDDVFILGDKVEFIHSFIQFHTLNLDIFKSKTTNFYVIKLFSKWVELFDKFSTLTYHFLQASFIQLFCKT